MPNGTRLGKIKRIGLREAWREEEGFSKWLVEDENLRLLSDEIGIDIKAIETEAEVGKFFADILAEEENTGRKIVIENQFTKTNHDHLGKLITYASGYDAATIIWIAEEVQEEHRRAVDWLNEHTEEEVNFFLVKMELWQISDSPFAPKFEVVSKPNDWAKRAKETVQHAKLTGTKLQQLEFWNRFKEYGQKKGSKLKFRKTSPQHWYDISVGSSEAHISLTMDTRLDLFGCELYINNNKDLFNYLLGRKEEIEAKLGEKVEWMELPDRKASRIKISRKGEVSEIERWNEYFDWLLSEAGKFQGVFSRYTKEFDEVEK
jgi:hypothetical protein